MSKIREARIKAGLTMKELSTRTGVPYRTLQNWETGDRTPPDYVERLILKELESEEKMENVKVFEFEQLGRKFRIELQYAHHLLEQHAWLDGDVLEMPAEPHENGTAKLFIDGELKYEAKRVSAYRMRLDENVETMKGYKVRKIHDLQLAIVDPKVWKAYEAWIKEAVETGTTEEVKEYMAQKQAAWDAADLAEARRVVELAEKQKDIPPQEEANRRMKWWNDTYNEGGEGVVPEIISREQYNRAQDIIGRLAK